MKPSVTLHSILNCQLKTGFRNFSLVSRGIGWYMGARNVKGETWKQIHELLSNPSLSIKKKKKEIKKRWA